MIKILYLNTKNCYKETAMGCVGKANTICNFISKNPNKNDK